MPTFTTIALDRLLEPESAATEKPTVAQRSPERPKMGRRALTMPSRKPPPPPPPVFPSPALYKTPEETPVPDSPSSFTPSPYVVNHKRRGPCLQKAQRNSADDGGNDHPRTGDPAGTDGGAAMKESGQGANVDGREERVGPVLDRLASDLGRHDKLLDHPVESRSPVGVNGKAQIEDRGVVDASQRSQTQINGEFFDAYEELSSDGGSTPVPNTSFFDLEKELSETRISLLVEKERRKQAEGTLIQMKSQWWRVAEQLSLAGIPFPASPPNLGECHEYPALDPIAELQQQVFVVRYVSDAVGRGYARAEIELEMEPSIEAKNFEISRLKDKVQYYEAVNREMSQRNQEAVDSARRERQRRKRRQRWVWGFVSIAISMGAAAVAWNYLAGGIDHGISIQSHVTVDNALEEEAA